MRPIQIDLMVDGEKVTTVDELRDRFSTQVVDHFRSGRLAEFLRTRRGLEKTAAAVEALPKDGDATYLLLELYSLFRSNPDKHLVEAALRIPIGIPGVQLKYGEILYDGHTAGVLAPGEEDRWRLEVARMACVTIEITAPIAVICALENTRGMQLAVAGDDGETQSPCIQAILSPGTYYVHLKRYRNKSTGRHEFNPGRYELKSNQKTNISTKNCNIFLKDLSRHRNVEKVLLSSPQKLPYIKSYDAKSVLSRDGLDIWMLDVPKKGIGASVTTAESGVDIECCLLFEYGQPIRQSVNLDSGASELNKSSSLSGIFALAVGSPTKSKCAYRLNVSFDKTSNQHNFESAGLAIILKGKGMSPTHRLLPAEDLPKGSEKWRHYKPPLPPHEKLKDTHGSRAGDIQALKIEEIQPDLLTAIAYWFWK